MKFFRNLTSNLAGIYSEIFDIFATLDGNFIATLDRLCVETFVIVSQLFTIEFQKFHYNLTV